MKYLSGGKSIKRTTEDVIKLVPPNKVTHYRNIHINISIFYVNKIVFFLVKSRDIGFIHCKPRLNKFKQQDSNALKTIVCYDNIRSFKVVSAYLDIAFEPITDWMKRKLVIVLTTYRLQCAKGRKCYSLCSGKNSVYPESISIEITPLGDHD